MTYKSSHDSPFLNKSQIHSLGNYLKKKIKSNNRELQLPVQISSFTINFHNKETADWNKLWFFTDLKST